MSEAKHIPESIMQRLRGRLRLSENDTSRDTEILSWSPQEMVRECTAWELGYSDWVDVIAEWMTAVGAKPEDFL